jgi:hypothetical protein
MKTEAEAGAMQPLAKEFRTAGNHQKLEEARKDPALELQSQHGPVITLVSDFQSLEL